MSGFVRDQSRRAQHEHRGGDAHLWNGASALVRLRSALALRRVDSGQIRTLTDTPRRFSAMEFPPTVWQISVLRRGRTVTRAGCLLTDTTVRPTAPRVS